MVRQTLTADGFTMGGVAYAVMVESTATRDVWKVTATADGEPVAVHPNGIKARRAIGQHQINGTVREVSQHLVAVHVRDAFDAAVEV